jgi:nucleoside 2-deoxyribosyltransferase/sugar/nucleoside kinase (ribokinase family)
MTPSRRIVLVGEVVVDVTLLRPAAENKLRMGGVFHAARGLWGLDVPYELAYLGPSYLHAAVVDHAKQHTASSVTCIGEIIGTPNVMLIAEATEAGSQGYEHLLCDEYRAILNQDALGPLLAGTDDTDVIVYSGNYPLCDVLATLKTSGARVHVDLGNGPGDLRDLETFGRPLDTLFLSTSSRVFPQVAGNLVPSIERLLGNAAYRIVLKENRGGARLFKGGQAMLRAGAQRRDIVHSVGVGDVFDATFLAFAEARGEEGALNLASWIAAEYAATTFPDDFQRACKRTLALTPDELGELPAVSLPWENRSHYQIYIAAPDFDYLDRRHIDTLAASLRYHNFQPRLPVREHGQAQPQTPAPERRRLCDSDVSLLQKCDLLIAVLSYDDPGTQIEIGLASGLGIPVIVYDPYERAGNIMLTELPYLVSSSLDKVITATFDLLAERCKST